jgi:hypothetical protein
MVVIASRNLMITRLRFKDKRGQRLVAQGFGLRELVTALGHPQLVAGGAMTYRLKSSRCNKLQLPRKGGNKFPHSKSHPRNNFPHGFWIE